MAAYEFIEHTADLGIVVRARTLEELFVEAARALFQILVQVKEPRSLRFSRCLVEGSDLEDLMVNWLRELLYLFNGEEKVVSSVEVLYLEPTRMEASLGWFPLSWEQDRVLTEIKAVTYHQIRVQKTDQGFETQIIFDI